MELLTDKTMCCGCTACSQVCPLGAIRMVADDEGFVYPSIDDSLCVDCGRCERVCCLKNQNRFASHTESVYGFKTRSEAVRMQSSSGGAFSALCAYIFSRRGAVAGVGFDKDFRACHQIAYTMEEAERFRGSKYIQSDLSDVYPQIQKLLLDGTPVLFTGTPCQCDGLKNYLYETKTAADDLILCDMVCHGVPSPMIWNDYLDFIGDRDKMTDYRFRDKACGWHGDNITVRYADGGKKTNTPKLKVFPTLYFSNYITRPSCSRCIYTNFERCSDLTIADFWGIEQTRPDFDDNKGVSMIMVNTPKGAGVYSEIARDADAFESEPAAAAQEQLKRPVSVARDRAAFWQDYKERGLSYTARRYGHYDMYHRTRRRIVNTVKKIRKQKP